MLAHMWLDFEIVAGSGSKGASPMPPSYSSSKEGKWSLSSSSSSGLSKKKGEQSQFEKILDNFFKQQIESSTLSAYDD